MSMMENFLNLNSKQRTTVGYDSECSNPYACSCFGLTEWEEAYNNLRGALGLSPGVSAPKPPRINTLPALAVTSTPDHSIEANTTSVKRKADSDQAGTKVDDSSLQFAEENNKRSRTAVASPQVPPLQMDSDSGLDASVHVFHAQAAAKFIPFLTPEHLMPPKLPSSKEMENVLLDLKKRALLEEYFGTENAPAGAPTTTVA
jgi:pre-mRNA-splicing factor ISY1